MNDHTPVNTPEHNYQTEAAEALKCQVEEAGLTIRIITVECKIEQLQLELEQLKQKLEFARFSRQRHEQQSNFLLFSP